MSQKTPIFVFTDGACSGNPGPGGYGTVIRTAQGWIYELGGGDPSTTNNRMEMMAVIAGLQALPEERGPLWVITDSVYVIRGITQWIHGWKRNQWKTSEGQPVSNQDLWIDLDKVVSRRKKLGSIEWKYVRGHQGTPGNERCDEIAVAFSQRRSISLYDGSEASYSIDLHRLPENMDLPTSTGSKSNKKAAYSYLSFVNGQLRRHKTWSECEAHVKGRSGAKFKKATSVEEERDIASGWGVDISKIINS